MAEINVNPLHIGSFGHLPELRSIGTIATPIITGEETGLKLQGCTANVIPIQKCSKLNY